jgi:hypothetical protein
MQSQEAKSSKTILVRAFKIKSCVEWMNFELGGEPSAACLLVCECGHKLSVNDAWAQVYTPEAGGWLLVNQTGRASYRSDVDFKAIAIHQQADFYHVPNGGDFAEPSEQSKKLD